MLNLLLLVFGSYGNVHGFNPFIARLRWIFVNSTIWKHWWWKVVCGPANPKSLWQCSLLLIFFCLSLLFFAVCYFLDVCLSSFVLNCYSSSLLAMPIPRCFVVFLKMASSRKKSRKGVLGKFFNLFNIFKLFFNESVFLL